MPTTTFKGYIQPLRYINYSLELKKLAVLYHCDVKIEKEHDGLFYETLFFTFTGEEQQINSIKHALRKEISLSK